MTRNRPSFCDLSSYTLPPSRVSTCFRSDVDRKARESRVSICRGRLRAACIDQTARTSSPVRPIEPDRSANPKYDYDTFVSMLNRDRTSFIGSVCRSYEQNSHFPMLLSVALVEQK